MIKKHSAHFYHEFKIDLDLFVFAETGVVTGDGFVGRKGPKITWINTSLGMGDSQHFDAEAETLRHIYKLRGQIWLKM